MMAERIEHNMRCLATDGRPESPCTCLALRDEAGASRRATLIQVARAIHADPDYYINKAELLARIDTNIKEQAGE